MSRTSREMGGTSDFDLICGRIPPHSTPTGTSPGVGFVSRVLSAFRLGSGEGGVGWHPVQVAPGVSDSADLRYNPLMSEDQEAQLRAERRKEWPVRVFRLGKEPSESLLGSTTAEERIAMMWPLAEEAYRLAGKLGPPISRAEMPVRCIRG